MTYPQLTLFAFQSGQNHFNDKPMITADTNSASPFRDRIYVAWDAASGGNATDGGIHVARSSDAGATFALARVDNPSGPGLGIGDTRNDTSGFRFMTDTFFTQSVDGGVTFRSPNVRVSSVSSNEHDCNGVFPCSAIDYGNQQGDYEGLASRGGVSHPIWTDSRRQLESSSGCRTNLLMEEVFTATVK
jgi:hypothetical protein